MTYLKTSLFLKKNILIKINVYSKYYNSMTYLKSLYRIGIFFCYRGKYRINIFY